MGKFHFKEFLNIISESNFGRLAQEREDLAKEFKKGSNLLIYPDFNRIKEVSGVDVGGIRPFIFSDYNQFDTAIEDSEFRLNLPFETVFFEALEQPLVTKFLNMTEDCLSIPKGNLDLRASPIEVVYRLETMGILVHEISIDTYYLVGLDRWIFDDFKFMKTGSPASQEGLIRTIFDTDFKGKISKYYTYEGAISRVDFDLVLQGRRQVRPEHKLHRSLVGMCECLRSKSYSTGRLKTNERVRIGNGLNRRKIRLENIVLVAPSKKKNSMESSLGSLGQIDWSHQFEVRGHWRKHDGIGKDRHGERNVHGYTWVSDHIRGPENMPLIRKTRIVDSSDEDDQKDPKSA